VAVGSVSVSATYTAVGSVQNSGAWVGIIKPKTVNPIIVPTVAVKRAAEW
jgi:hypothetical protein